MAALILRPPWFLQKGCLTVRACVYQCFTCVHGAQCLFSGRNTSDVAGAVSFFTVSVLSVWATFKADDFST